ncbi:MAG TPA: AMP-binding protein [Pilimelia sp.]|nr:AMP-binding protein [Pilimelia sp.]
MTPLLSWLESPSTDQGIRFASPDGSWDFWSYARLAGLAQHTAWALREAGVRDGDVVAVVERSGPAFVGALFGTLLAGAVATPVAPPMTFRDPDAYADHLTGLLSTARPALVVCHPGVTGVVAPAAATAGVRLARTDDLLAGVDAPPRPPGRPPADLALVQFTSGTSGRVRGVRVGHTALAANVAAIQRWLGMGPDDPTASWLPVHHDMGLVGCLLAPVVTGSDLWLMPPEEFVRRPLRYLRCFGEYGARLTALPTFGLAHVVRRVRPEDLVGMDFTRWRAIIVGAERVVPETLERFVALCGPAGLARRAMLPAYGLAEATLAVTGLPLAEQWSAVEPPGQAPVVGCGRPLHGVEVTVVDDAGVAVPDGQAGEIVVGGASVGAGYQGGAGFPGGRVHTGDAGFLRDGQLFVLGRLGDSLKIRGKGVFAEDLEALLVTGLGVPAGRVACLLGLDRGRATAVLVFEHARPEWARGAEAVVRRTVEGARVVTADVPAGTVPRTSSGKPRRHLLWRSFLAGELAPARDLTAVGDGTPPRG